MKVIELPTVEFTDYFYQNYKHMGKDKPEMFGELVRTLIHDELGYQLYNNVTYVEAKKYEAEMKSEYLSKKKAKKD